MKAVFVPKKVVSRPVWWMMFWLSTLRLLVHMLVGQCCVWLHTRLEYSHLKLHTHSLSSGRTSRVIHRTMWNFWMFLLFFLPANTPTALTERKVEQRSVLKFLCKTGATPIQCWRQMSAVFGADCMSKNRVRVWFKRFQQGRESPKDNKHPRRKKTTGSDTNVTRVNRALTADQRKTVRMLSEELDLPKSGVHRILKADLKLLKIAPKLVPKLLNDEQKAFRKKLCTENLEALSQDDTILSRVITGDESWVSVREVDTKQMSSQWIPKGSCDLRPVKAKRQCAKKKVMLTVFWDENGPVLVDFLPRGESVTSDRYVELLGRLKENIRRRRLHLWQKDPSANDPEVCKFIIHHDNASSHTAAISLAFFLNIPMLPHPPYSPDIAPSDYFLFPRLKAELAQMPMQARTIPVLQEAVQRVLRRILKEHY